MAIKKDLGEALADYRKFMAERYPSISLNNWNTSGLEGFTRTVKAIDPSVVPAALERGTCPYKWHPLYRKGRTSDLPPWVDGDGWLKLMESEPGSAYSVVLWWAENNMRNHE